MGWDIAIGAGIALMTGWLLLIAALVIIRPEAGLLIQLLGAGHDAFDEGRYLLGDGPGVAGHRGQGGGRSVHPLPGVRGQGRTG
jgi:hypothetical protein